MQSSRLCHLSLIVNPTCFDGVLFLGVDEHAWRNTRRWDKFVNVIVSLTPVRDGIGSLTLIGMIKGRSK